MRMRLFGGSSHTSGMRVIGLAALVTMLGVTTVTAQTWNRNGPDTNWTNAANWVGGIVPVGGATTTLTFTGGAPFFDDLNSVNDTNAAFELNRILFESSAGYYWLRANTTNSYLRFVGSNATIENNSNVLQIIEQRVDLATTLSIAGTGTTGNVTFNREITGSGGLVINAPTDIRPVFLSASNSFSGGIHVQRGRVTLTTTGASGFGTIRLGTDGGNGNGVAGTNGQVFGQAAGAFRSGVTIRGASGGNGGAGGVGGVGGAATASLGGNQAYSSSTVYAGNGGDASAGFAGGTGGLLTASNSNFANSISSTSTLRLVGGTGGSGATAAGGAGGNVLFNATSNNFIGGNIELLGGAKGAGVLGGAGGSVTLRLTGNNIGTSSSANVIWVDGGTDTGAVNLDLNGFSVQLGGISTGGLVRNDWRIRNTAAAANSTLTLKNTAANTFGGIIENGGTGTLSLTKDGAGNLTLTNANAYTGVTSIIGGTITLTGAGTLGSGAVTISGDFSGPYSKLILDKPGDYTLTQAVGGLGQVIKNGGGTLTLVGTNTVSNYDGAFAIIGGGTIQFAPGSKGGGGTLLAAEHAKADGNGGNGTILVNAADVITFTQWQPRYIAGNGSVAGFRGGDLYVNISSPQNASMVGSWNFEAGDSPNSTAGQTSGTGGNAVVDVNATIFTNSFTSISFSPGQGGNAALNTVGGVGGNMTAAINIPNAFTGTGVVTITGASNGFANSASGAAGGLGGTGLLTFYAPQDASTNRVAYQLGANTVGTPGSVASLNMNGFNLVANSLASNFTDKARITNSTATPVTISLVTDNAANNSFGAIIEDGVAGGVTSLVKSGAQKQTFTNANTYSGGTTINAGTIELTDTGTLGSGSLLNNGTLAFNIAGATTFAKNIPGSGGVLKTGAGKLTLTGANSYVGGTLVNGGTLVALTDAGLGAAGAAVTINGARFEWGGNLTIPAARPLTVGTGGATFSDGGFAAVYEGNITGNNTVAFTGSGAGSLTLRGTANKLTTNNAIATITNTNLILENGAVFELAPPAANNLNQTLIANTLGSTGTLTIRGAGSTWREVFQLNVGAVGVGAVNITDGGKLSTWGAQIGSNLNTPVSGSLVVSGAGSRWEYSQGVQVGRNGAGTLLIENGGVVSGTSEFALALFNERGYASDATITGVGSLLSASSIRAGSGGNGIMTVQNGGTVNTNFLVVGGSFLVANVQGMLNVQGAGSSVNVVNDLQYAFGTGRINITDGGLLRIGRDSLINTFNTLAADNGTLQTTKTIGFGGMEVSNSGLTLSQSGDSTYSGVIKDGTAPGNFTKSGVGVLTMTGIHTYTGATTVAQGGLAINGSIASSSSVTVLSGATLSGTGNLGNIVGGGGGNISPGNSPGTMSGTSLLWDEGASLLMELGTVSDRINLAGRFDFGVDTPAISHFVGISDAGGITAGTYRLVKFAAGQTNIDLSQLQARPTGNLVGVSGRFDWEVQGADQYLTYQLATFQPVPAPPAWLTLPFGAGVMGAMQWLRRVRRRHDRRTS